MNNEIEKTLIKCHRSCIKECELGTECLSIARDGQLYEEWLKGQVDKLIPYLKKNISTFPCIGSLSITIKYDDGVLTQVSFSGVDVISLSPRYNF